MKKAVLSLLLAFACSFLFARDYYISNTGNDANTGDSPAAAWQTINKLNASWGSIVSGDRILFQCGGTFFGGINVTKSGITLGSYGTGAKPIITGFYTVPSWTAAGTNLWTATIPTSLNNIRMLTVNDRVTRVGRFPNYVDGFAAWIRYTNTLPASSPVTVNGATAVNPNLADGELVLYKFNWNLDVMPINSIAGNGITCTNPAGLYGIASGGASYGGLSFFVQNSINALDQNNEWHYRNATKVLTMFSPTNPSDRVVKIATVQTLITLGANSNITIDNLDIQGATEKGIVSTGGSNVIIRNCVVKCIQGWGIDMRAGNALVQNNLVRDIGSNGIWIGSSATVTGNVLRSVGAVEGLPGLTNSGAGTQGNQDDQHEGLLLQSSNGITCTFNEFDSIGYNAIKHAGSNIRMEKNFIKFPCVTKSDGGGIYCWDVDGTVARTNRIIKNNIIVNSNKFLYGTSTPGGNTQGYGIYFDGGTNGGATGLICDSNVIAPSNFGQNAACNNPTNTTDDGGIMMNNPRNIFIRNNIVFGWPDAMEMWRWPSMPDASGNRIIGNALYVNAVGNASDACTWNQSFQYHELGSSAQATVQAQIQAFGVMDSNYVNDNAISPFIYKNQSWIGPATKLAAWRTYSGKDANTKTFPNTTPDFQYNATNTPRTYSFPGVSKIDFRGVVYNNSAVIPPFYGNIFFPNGSAPSGNAPVVTATATTISCNGGNSTVTVTATGGTAPYTGTGTFTRTAGTYTFTVTDANNLTGSTTITIGQPAALTAGNPTAPAITTVGGTTTITQPVPTGGTAPYQYQLGTVAFQSANTFSGVVAGTYTITIRDANQCTITRSITIAPFVASQIVVTSSATSILCNGGSSTVTVSATGGTPPYIGTGTFTRTAGTYTFTVTDAANASSSSTITITQPTLITAGNPTAPAITSVGGTTTITQPVPTGGTVTTGASAIDITELPGTLTVQGEVPAEPKALLIDNNPATKWVDFSNANPTTRSSWIQWTLSGPGQVVTSYTLTSGGDLPERDPSNWNLVGSNDGGVTWVTLDTRTGETFASRLLKKTYTISNTTAYTTYRLNITRVFAPSTLYCCVQLAEIEFIRSSTTTSGYQYRIGTGAYQTSNVFPNVSAGTYTITIRDANQCTITKNITIGAFVPNLASTALAPGILCGGGTTTITVTATGGTPPYTGTGTFVRPAGTHTFTVTDAAGVTTTSVVTLTEPPALIVTANATAINCVGGSSTVTISATGGTPPYTGTGSFTRVAGTHTFDVLDTNGCKITVTAQISEPQIVQPVINR